MTIKAPVFVPSIELAPVQGQLFGRPPSGGLYSPAPEGPARPLTLKRGLLVAAILFAYLGFLVFRIGASEFVENPGVTVGVFLLMAVLVAVRLMGKRVVGGLVAELKRRRAFQKARRASVGGTRAAGMVVAMSATEMRSLGTGVSASTGIRYADWGHFALRTPQGLVFVDPSFAWISDAAGTSLAKGQEVEVVGTLAPGTLPGFVIEESSYRGAATPRVARGTSDHPLIITPR